MPVNVGNSEAACEFGDGVDTIGVLIFVGILLLFIGGLLCIFLFHVTVVSGVEATWLSKVRQPRWCSVARCPIRGHHFILESLFVLFVILHKIPDKRHSRRSDRRVEVLAIILSV